MWNVELYWMQMTPTSRK